ncbi:NAD-dependent epimerase/dehydratase family protein [Pseudomonas sp. RIT-PI-AD]|uniref:NAD-dependent epimerase/dehydratase family protein n=1 Tax=Pseudomonas sp. RIT-PI-AD TaxID=3035294 RepID=UPI0021DA94AA|nr:NAD-dependent epimerase/dehydratase family protein [Pseudomonas sp. RIT-PI-AD]
MAETCLVTGANGFVGRTLCERLVAEGWQVRRAMRRAEPGHDCIGVGDIDGATDWSSALAGVATIVHTAGCAHVLKPDGRDMEAEYRTINVDGTLNLARQAMAAGVRRFVFVSSIKVNGESTRPGAPFTPFDRPAPEDAYGRSKWEAEQGLRALCEGSAMEFVIVRPPLVYGPGVRANFAALIRLVRSGLPLPLGRLDNRRSLVALDNLVDLLVLCLRHPAAAGQTFLVRDGEDLSTTELVRRLAVATERPSRLLPMPGFAQRAMLLLGQDRLHKRLYGSLQVDDSATRERLGWQPGLSVDQGLRRAVSVAEGQ